mgnify:CR=1 FL=1
MRKYGYLERVLAQLRLNNVETLVYDKILPKPHQRTRHGSSRHLPGRKMWLCSRPGRRKFHRLRQKYSCYGLQRRWLLGLCIRGLVAKDARNQSTSHYRHPYHRRNRNGNGSMDSNYPRNGSRKIGFGCQLTFPTLSIVDPELMVSITPAPHRLSRVRRILPCRRRFYRQLCNTHQWSLCLRSHSFDLQISASSCSRRQKNLKARAKIAWASTLAGMVEATSSCTSEHSLEHAMSAYYPQLPHGAGLIALSEAYFETFRHDCTKRYMKMAEVMTEKKSNRASDFIDALVTMQKWMQSKMI